jgi:group I intron endonuclease
MKGIYTIRHIETDRCYVGSSVNIARRWVEHRRLIRAGKHPAKHMLNAFQKYGSDAFAFEILEECDVSDDAIRCERENHWIDKLKPVFNVAPVAGSVLGLKRSAEARANMSKAQKGRISTLKGVPRTPEVRAKISESSKKRVFSEEHKLAFSQARKGTVSPRRGVKLSDETKAKISKNRRGIPRDPALVEYVASLNRGRVRGPMSEETKQKLSFPWQAKRLNREMDLALQ